MLPFASSNRTRRVNFGAIAVDRRTLDGQHLTTSLQDGGNSCMKTRIFHQDAASVLLLAQPIHPCRKLEMAKRAGVASERLQLGARKLHMARCIRTCASGPPGRISWSYNSQRAVFRFDLILSMHVYAVTGNAAAFAEARQYWPPRETRLCRKVLKNGGSQEP